MNELQPLNVETFKGLISTAPNVLEQNRTSITKATEVFNRLLTAVDEIALNEALWTDEQKTAKKKELDPQLNNYLVRLRETYKAMYDRRTPITGIFDDIKKMFTSLETSVDPKGKGNLYDRIQEIRNRWAREEAEANRLKQLELQKQQSIESEKIRLKSEAELQIRKIFLAHVENEQSMLVKVFESLTLEKFDAQADFIRNYSSVYFITHFEAIEPTLNPVYVDKSEIPLIITNAKAGKFVEFSTEFKDTIEGLKEMFIEKLASKKAELEEIAAAKANKCKEICELLSIPEATIKNGITGTIHKTSENELEIQATYGSSAFPVIIKKTQIKPDIEYLFNLTTGTLIKDLNIIESFKTKEDILIAEQQQRQEEDAAAIAKANEEKVQVAETQTQVNNSAMQANLMFDMQSQVQQATPTQPVREGYAIKVLNAAGWLQIVAFYFEKEGLKKDVETLSKMKLESMKSWAEKHAIKTGERIQNTALVYEETYKAVVKK